MSLKNFFESKIFRNSVWLTTGSAARSLVAAVTSILLARFLTQDSYGNLQFVVSIICVIQSLESFAYPNIVKKNILHFKHQQFEIVSSAQKIIFFIYLPVVLVFALLYFLNFKLKFWSGEVLGMLFVASIGLLFSSLNPVGSWLDSQLDSKKSASIQFFALLLSHTAKIFFAIFGFPLIWQSFAISLQNFFHWISYRLIKKKGLKNNQKSSENYTKSIFRQSLPFFYSMLFLNILYKADQVILGILSDSKTVAVYAAAVKLSEPWSNLIMGVVVSVFPGIIEKAKESKEAMLDGFVRSLKWITFLGLMMCLFVSFFADKLIMLIFGEAYLASIPLLRIHIWANLFTLWFYSQNVLEVELGLGKQLIYKSFFAAFLNVVLNLMLIPRYGAMGSVISTIIGYSFLGAFGNLFFQKSRFIFSLIIRSFFPW